MSPAVTRYSLIAAAVLSTMTAACREQQPSSQTTTTVSTGAVPGSTTTETGAATGTATSTTATAPAATTPVSYAEAETAYREGRYGDAKDLFAGFTQANPKNAWGHYMLGLSAWKASDPERALESFDEALKIDPNHQKSLLNSARVLLETARAKEALERVERALAIDSLSGDALRLLGRTRYELGDVPEAIDAYQRAIAVNEHDSWAMNNMGYIYIQQGRSEDALLPLARAVELRSGTPVFQNNLGTALERCGHFAAAKQAYEAALAADSTYSKASTGLARVTGREDSTGSAPVDLSALSQEFQSQVQQWRETTVSSDSTMARDSVSH
ncbi:MAG TPA: tetratricopeptide repeat protein [Gemmatimonadales bacterium]